jgi:hypothetical protein
MNDNRVKIFTIAHIPPALQQAWLQHLRDFDTAHPNCHFEVGIDAPDVPFNQVLQELTLNPRLTFTQVFDRKPIKMRRGDR